MLSYFCVCRNWPECSKLHLYNDVCAERLTSGLSYALDMLPGCNIATVEFTNSYSKNFTPAQGKRIRWHYRTLFLSLTIDSPKISPKQVQHAAKCYQFLCNSGHEDRLTTTSRMILVGLNCITVVFTVHVNYDKSSRMWTCRWSLGQKYTSKSFRNTRILLVYWTIFWTLVNVQCCGMFLQFFSA